MARMKKINLRTCTEEEMKAWCKRNREIDNADFMSQLVKKDKRRPIPKVRRDNA